MQTGFAGLHLFAGRLSLFALHSVGAEPRPYRTHPKGSPCRGAVSRRLTERLYQTCSDLSVSAAPSHLPWKGRLWAVLICKIIRQYGNIAIGAKHLTLRYNDTSISKKCLRFRAGSGILRPAETDSGCVPRCSGLANHKRKRLKL